MEHDVKVRIIFPIDDDLCEIFIYEKHEGRNYIAKKVELEFHQLDLNTRMEPTLILPGIVAKGMLQALATEIARHGLHPDESRIEGKLEATEYHLQDLRTLLKLYERNITVKGE